MNCFLGLDRGDSLGSIQLFIGQSTEGLNRLREALVIKQHIPLLLAAMVMNGLPRECQLVVDL